MAFGNISTFYFPSAANAGASQWGTDVRKLLDTADATSDGTSLTGHGTGAGAARRTIDPYTTSSTDTTESNFGWAINPTDMNSVVGALRYFPAGNHTITARMTHNGSIAETGTIFMFAYRVGDAAGGRVRTLLGSTSASVAFPALSGSVTMTCTLALSEVVFQVDETIQYSFELTLNGVPLTGHQGTFWTGTVGGVASRIATPTLKVLAETIGSASGSAAADGSMSKVLGTIGSSDGSSSIAGVGASTAGTTGTAQGSGVAVGAGSSVAGTVGTASGVGTANGLTSIVLGTTGTVEIGATGGGTTIIRKIFNIFGDDE